MSIFNSYKGAIKQKTNIIYTKSIKSKNLNLKYDLLRCIKNIRTLKY